MPRCSLASTTAVGQSISIFTAGRASSGRSWLRLPGQFFDIIPYLVTIMVLAGVVGRSIPPAADGQPYQREGDELTREEGATALPRGLIWRRVAVRSGA